MDVFERSELANRSDGGDAGDSTNAREVHDFGGREGVTTAAVKIDEGENVSPLEEILRDSRELDLKLSLDARDRLVVTGDYSRDLGRRISEHQKAVIAYLRENGRQFPPPAQATLPIGRSL
jgi:hypothetical protein